MRPQRVDTLRRFYYGGGDGVPTGPRGPATSSSAACTRWSTSLGDIDAREINSIPIGDDGIVLRVGRYGPYLERERTGDDGEPTTERAPVPEDLAARRADRREGRGAAGPPVRRPRARHRPGDRAAGRGEGRPLRAVRHRGAARRRAQERQAAHRVAVQDDVARHRHARRRAAAAVAAAGGRASTRPTARRSPRRTAATGRT